MKKRSKGVLSQWAAVLIVLAVLLAAGPVWAADSGATQGQVALNLANLLGLSLPVGATEADAISALAAQGIAPSGGWNASAPADSSFIGSLYVSVQAAITAGRVTPGALGSASAVMAAACVQANIPRTVAVNAIVGAGGDRAAANQGASYGGNDGGGAGGGGGGGYGPGGRYSFGPSYGGGGGGGGANPSPSR